MATDDVPMIDKSLEASDDYPKNAGATNSNNTTSKSSTSASANATDVKKPKLKPRPNPLAKYSSYTYQISLYMITPDAYDLFVQSGRSNINQIGNGVFLIVQSGGINNETSTRAPGMKFNYFIDDLKMTSACSSKKTGGLQTITTELSFNIYEPYGFSFMSDLKKSFDQMKAISKTQNIDDTSSVWRQFYILGLRFLGYDKDGNVMPTAAIEKYFDININEVSFKIDGKMVCYACKAVNLPANTAFGNKRGRIGFGSTVIGSTVSDALIGMEPDRMGLLTKLNNDQERLVKANSAEFAAKYSIEFIKNDNGDDANEIAKSKIVSNADKDKSRLPFTNVKTTVNVNVAAGEKAAPDPTKRHIVFKNDTPIVQAITQIILQSDYIESALKVYEVSKEVDQKTDKPELVNQNSNKTLKWFSIAPLISNPRWDRIRKDFVFDIKYRILTYNTPFTLTSYAENPGEYPGAIKRYEYWYTGKNSEITRFEQTINNAYYMVALNPKTSGGLPGADIPQANDQRANASTIGKGGDPGTSMAAQNNYVTSLLDPGSWAEAKIEILGDPEYLITELVTNPTNGTYNYTTELDSSLGAYSGQAFIEIDFKEGIDYNGQTGVMDINKSINFVNYPPAIQQQVEGISYMLVEVLSSFSKGSFKQTLSLVLNLFNDKISKVSQSAAQVTVTKEGEVKTTQPAETQNTAGLKTNPPAPSNTASSNPTQPVTDNTNTTRTVPTKNGNATATDESNPKASPKVPPAGREPEKGDVQMIDTTYG